MCIKTLLSCFLVSASLFSGPLASAASWKFADLSTPADPHGACVVYVDDSEDKTGLRLQIARAKGGVGPAEVFLIETKQFSPAVTWLLTPLSPSQTMGLAEISRSATERVFWHPPVNTQLIVNQIASDKEIKIYAAGSPKKMDTSFSRSNFTKAVQELQAKCLGGRPLVDSNFESLFLKNVVVSGDLQNKSGTPAIQLRDLYHSGFQTYLEQGANNQKINDVIARYKTTIDEFNMVTSRIQVLTQSEIPNLQNGIAQQKINRANAEAELKRVTAAIPGLEAAVARDQGILDRARAIRAPYEAENNRLEGVLDDAERNLSAARNYLAQVQNSIAATNRDLNNAQNELANLRNNMSNLQWRVRQSENELQQARMERDRFDANSEIRRRIDRDPRIQQRRNEVQNLQMQVGQLQGQVGAAQNEVYRTQGALSQCQATAGADCSSQQAAYDSAQAQFNQVNSQLQYAQSQLNNSQNDLQRMISQIERDVRNQEAELNRRVDRATDQLNTDRRELDRAVYRQRDLEVTIIPNLQRDLRNLDADLRRAQSDVAGWDSEVRSASADLDAYRRKVDWAGKTAAINNAADALDRSTDARDSAYANKARQERIIADSNSTQATLEATLAARTNELSQLQTRRAQLQPTMDKYAAERAPFDAEAARLDRLMAGYQSQYKQTVEGL